MMYQFQSLLRNVDIQGVGQFRDFHFQTDNEEVVARLRKNSGFNINIFEIPVGGEQPPARKKLPKGARVKVVNGARSSDVHERENE